MVREVDPRQTRRAEAFALWMKAPMPMVTLFKTLDVTRLVKFSRKKGYPFNMLLCWCIGRAASRREDFFLLPVGDKLMAYDRLAVSVVVKTNQGGIQTCDIPVTDDFQQFHRDYQILTGRVRETAQPHDLSEGAMVIGTSVLADHEIDGAVNIYAGIYNNPFLIWGKYRRGWFKTTLPMSFQFHHTQMDGIPAAEFLVDLQREINQFNP